MLLTRDDFRNKVFIRDNNLCVICKSLAVDAHHIMERRLFFDGGYYIDNGASLCSKCHIMAEETTLDTKSIRTAAGIKKVILPEHLYPDNEYDKWGNIILQNETRLRGELFFDESVQKILKQGNVLGLFCNYIKYPRTYHLPWSNPTKDDKTLQDLSNFENKNVVVTIKLDGENTSMYRDYIHARSIDSKSHWTQSWIRNFHGKIKHEIPEGWRICGENLYAKHSIEYNNLLHYFYIFSIWNERNVCLSWNETVEFASLLGVPTPKVVYEGIWDINLIKSLKIDYKNQEGYVIRLEESFNYGNFKNSVAKYVRPNHVVGTHHWKYNQIELNKVCENQL